MNKIYNGFDELVGNTPLAQISRFCKAYDLNARLLAKLEFFNPAGSIKERIAVAMINDAESNGVLRPGSVIIEPTSGNTGIGLAAYAASKGYRVIFTMPETMSIERRKLLSAYGAEIVLTEGAKGITGSIQKAEELAKSFSDSFIPGQFSNPANPEMHRRTTGPEIWEATEGKIDIFVAGVGTGGTLTGTGEFLKSKNENIKIYAVEPDSSPVLSEGRAGPNAIQGIGAGFVPKVLNTSIYDEVIRVKTYDAFDCARTLAKTEGLLAGISSGAALAAAVSLARRTENKEKNIVVILPDTGERYLSTDLFGSSN